MKVNLVNILDTLRKTNNVVSKQVRHKPVCAVTETGLKLEISDLRRRVSVLSV